MGTSFDVSKEGLFDYIELADGTFLPGGIETIYQERLCGSGKGSAQAGPMDTKLNKSLK